MCVIAILFFGIIFIIAYKKEKDNEKPSSYTTKDMEREAWDNLRRRKAAAAKPEDEGIEALKQMLIESAGPDGPYHHPFQDLPDSVEEYIDHKHGKGSYTMEDYRRDQDRKRLEEKLDENIRLQKEILDKMSKQ